MIRPWNLPPGAHLDPRWNTALDLSASLGISLAELSAAWEQHGGEWVLVMLRSLASETAAARRAG
jgi:hypothetical protein